MFRRVLYVFKQLNLPPHYSFDILSFVYSVTDRDRLEIDALPTRDDEDPALASLCPRWMNPRSPTFGCIFPSDSPILC